RMTRKPRKPPLNQPKTSIHAKSIYSVSPSHGIHPLSLHDALPISRRHRTENRNAAGGRPSPDNEPELPGLAQSGAWDDSRPPGADRKSTRLNSSHQIISYAVFCLKKKNHHVA